VFVTKSIKNSACGKGAVDPFLLKNANSPFGETDPNSAFGEESQWQNLKSVCGEEAVDP
jgi:hypothetical protein